MDEKHKRMVNKVWGYDKRTLKQRLCILTIKQLSPSFIITDDELLELESISTITNIHNHKENLQQGLNPNILSNKFYIAGTILLGKLLDKEWDDFIKDFNHRQNN